MRVEKLVANLEAYILVDKLFNVAPNSRVRSDNLTQV